MTDLVVQLVEQGGYAAIALLMCLENVFPPIPSEVIMGLGGVEAGQGTLAFWPVVAAGTVGSVLGNYAWFALARRVGRARLDRLVERHGRWLTMQPGDVERVNRFFLRHGQAAVCLARMVPGVRTLISVPAGLFGMSHGRFLVWTALGATGWNAALAWAGYEFGRRVEAADQYTGPISTAVLALILVAYLWRVARWRPED